MGTSDITVAALAATPGVGYIDLAWTYDDPRDGALPSIALDQVEVWAASTNNRAVATKVVEGITSARHSGVANGATWYYWIKPRNNVGSYGAFHPSSATGGVSGTEATATQVTLSALTAVVNVSQASLQWVITDPSSTGLGYLGLAAVEIWAASTNDRAGASKVTEGLTSAVHDAIPEGETRYYWIRPRNRNGTFGSFFPSSSTAGVVATVRDQVGLAFGLANGKLVASVAANALTVAIKTVAGNDPSASDSVFIAFPNSDVTIGSYQTRRVSTALSITVPEFQQLGTANNIPFRVWVVLFDDAGTLRLGVKVASNSAALISPISEGALASSSAVSSAPSSYTFYTTVAVTSKPLRIIGECIWNSGLATAGLWTAGPSATRLIVPGSRSPGSRSPAYSALDLGSYTSTATIPFDDTKPEITEGLQLDSFAFTARAACNIIEVESIVNLSHSVASEMIGALFVDGATNSVASDFAYVDTAGKLTQIVLKFRVIAGSIAARTYSIRIGPSQAGTMTLNGSGGARKLGGVLPIVTNADEIEG